MAELETTIESYDATASQYASRWDGVSMGRELSEFADRLTPGSLVLDVGCGMARDAAAMNNAGLRAFGVDLSIGMSRVAAEKGVGVAQADTRMLPFAPGTFDAVWANASLLHLDEQAFIEAMAEIAEVVKPGGLVYVSVKERTEGLPETVWIDVDKGAPRWYKFWTESELCDVFDGMSMSTELLTRNEQRAGVGAPFINFYLRTSPR